MARKFLGVWYSIISNLDDSRLMMPVMAVRPDLSGNLFSKAVRQECSTTMWIKSWFTSRIKWKLIPILIARISPTVKFTRRQLTQATDHCQANIAFTTQTRITASNGNSCQCCTQPIRRKDDTTRVSKTYYKNTYHWSKLRKVDDRYPFFFYFFFHFSYWQLGCATSPIPAKQW